MAGEDPSAYQTVAPADVDGGFGGSSVGSATQTNSLEITAPEDWVLVASGSAFINNQTGGVALLGLRPAVDGTLLQGAAGNASFISRAANETESLTYTVAFEVSAGAHTVVQTAGVLSAAGTPIAGNFFYNANQLTAEWHPEGSVSLATAEEGGGDIDG